MNVAYSRTNVGSEQASYEVLCRLECLKEKWSGPMNGFQAFIKRTMGRVLPGSVADLHRLARRDI